MAQDFDVADVSRCGEKERRRNKRSETETLPSLLQHHPLLSSLRMWHKIVQTIKRQKRLLTQYFHRQKKRNLRMWLREWKLHVEQIKQNRTKTSLGAAENKHGQMQVQEEKLKDELKRSIKEKEAVQKTLSTAEADVEGLERELALVNEEIDAVQEKTMQDRAVARAELCDNINVDALNALQNRFDDAEATMVFADLRCLLGVHPGELLQVEGLVSRVQTHASILLATFPRRLHSDQRSMGRERAAKKL